MEKRSCAVHPGRFVQPGDRTPFPALFPQIQFFRQALQLTEDGRFAYPELLFSAPKKSGKTTLAAIITLYVVIVLGGRYSEGYCIANDFEQAQSRVFQAIVRIVEVSPLLRQSAKITSSRVEFLSTRATTTALASDYAGAAGANPTITVLDELWGYTSERAHRLWLGILGASEAKEANLSGQDDVSPRLV